MKVIVGVDPGPVTGIFGIELEGGRVEYNFAQVDPVWAWRLVTDMKGAFDLELVVEDFVVGKATARTADRKAGEVTRGVLEQLRPYATTVRRASDVKPWSTDERLKAAGILDKLQGMRHAKDAARHALFHAVRSGILVDPLSKEWKYTVS